MATRPLLPLSRRDILAHLGAGASALLVGSPNVRASTLAESAMARGTVFDDTAGDGMRRSDRRALSGIMVSNGRDVTLTDASGAWALPVRAGDSVFVIKPAHWSIVPRAGSAHGHYLYQPDGTPPRAGLSTPQVSPTGALPKSIDFALRRTPEPRAFEALLVADTQAANARELSFVRAELLHCLGETRAQFAIHHGDVMGDDLSLLPDHLALTAETGMPWYHCPGNHDMNLDSSTPAYAFEAWKQAMGCTHSAFQYAGATFFLLNNVEYFGRGGAARDGRGYRGFIGQDQIDFIANVLRHVPQDQLIVVSMHIPLVSFESPNSISDTTADRRALLRLLSGRQHTVSFSGHSHTTEHHYLGRADGFDRDMPHHHHVLTAACGSWWSGVPDARGVPISDSRDGTPKGIHVLSVDGNRYTTRLVTSPCAGASPLRAMIAKLPAQTALSERVEDHLVVDVFDGGPRTRVSCHCAEFGEQPIAMERVAIADPHIVESFARHKALSKPWVAPAPSSHIWTLPLPAAFEGRSLNVTVQVKSEFGETYEIRQVLARRMPAGEHLRI